MSAIAVVDSACLIALENIGHLEILPTVFSSIHAPPAVKRECGDVPQWLEVLAPTDRTVVAALQLAVDDGEAEAIALAVELQCRIILDDLQARAVAQRMGLEIIGTVGILIRAKQTGSLTEVKPVLTSLSESGFYLSQPLMREVLRLAGE